MNFETTYEIEMAITRHIGTKDNVIIPNLSFGLFPYELDLCILNRNLYASEVEIKISKSDLKADAKKNHHHDRNGNYIKYLWFAMPEKMNCCLDLVPDRAGIYLVDSKGHVRIARKPKQNKLVKRWDYKMAFRLARLGTIRLWAVKLLETR